MEQILTVIVMVLALSCGLLWSVTRKQDAVILTLRVTERVLEAECARLRAADDTLFHWMKLNGEYVIDELTHELDVLSATPEVSRVSFRRQIFLFDSLALMVQAGMEGEDEVIREVVRQKITLFRERIREVIKP